MKLAEEAFTKLFPDKESDYSFNVRYSGKFRAYNANVRYTRHSFTFNISRKWKGVSRDIQIGLIQSLLCKVFKEKKKTMEMDLYHSFLKKVHVTIATSADDDVLQGSFDRVNAKYMDDMLEMPNLKWHDGRNRLGSYEFGTDTISLSRGLLKHGEEMLDYVMYHEMLHKKHKFTCSGTRTMSHTKAFREDEAYLLRFSNISTTARALIISIRP